MGLRARWERAVAPYGRATRLPPRLVAHLPARGTVLDVGSGDGLMARAILRDRPGLQISGVDVVLQPDPAIPVTRFDGRVLPWADASVDTVLLVDVLHHAEDAAGLLREARRVARHDIVVKDHDWLTGFDHWLLRLSDDLGNRGKGVALPYAYLRPEEWDALFQRTGLAVQEQSRFRYSALDRCRQVIFRLCATDAPGRNPGTRRRS